MMRIVQSSVFFVKFCSKPIRPKLESLRPGRRATHLLTDRFQRHIGISLDDKFVMDMHDDAAAPQGLHGVAEDVAGCGLDTIAYDAESPSVPDGESVPRTTIPDVVDMFLESGLTNRDSTGQLWSIR